MLLYHEISDITCGCVNVYHLDRGSVKVYPLFLFQTVIVNVYPSCRGYSEIACTHTHYKMICERMSPREY